MKMKNENIQDSFRERIDYIFSDEELVTSNERALYMLLTDHPDFIKSITKVRKVLGIPKEGFSDGESAFRWQNSNKLNSQKLKQYCYEIISDYKIKSTFSLAVKFFIEDYIICPKIVHHLLPLDVTRKESKKVEKVGKRKIIATRVLQTSKNIEINKYLILPDTLYLEILPNTTLRDVSSAWKHISLRRKDMRPLEVSKIDSIARNVWKLGEFNIPDKEIMKIVNGKYDTKFGYSDIPVYRKRYRDSLEKLRPISTK